MEFLDKKTSRIWNLPIVKRCDGIWFKTMKLWVGIEQLKPRKKMNEWTNGICMGSIGKSASSVPIQIQIYATQISARNSHCPMKQNRKEVIKTPTRGRKRVRCMRNSLLTFFVDIIRMLEVAQLERILRFFGFFPSRNS